MQTLIYMNTRLLAALGALLGSEPRRAPPNLRGLGHELVLVGESSRRLGRRGAERRRRRGRSWDADANQRAKLVAKGLSATAVSASDENSIDDANANLRGFAADTLAAIRSHHHLGLG